MRLPLLSAIFVMLVGSTAVSAANADPNPTGVAEAQQVFACFDQRQAKFEPLGYGRNVPTDSIPDMSRLAFKGHVVRDGNTTYRETVDPADGLLLVVRSIPGISGDRVWIGLGFAWLSPALVRQAPHANLTAIRSVRGFGIGSSVGTGDAGLTAIGLGCHGSFYAAHGIKDGGETTFYHVVRNINAIIVHWDL
jgi:hypothetical protein